MEDDDKEELSLRDHFAIEALKELIKSSKAYDYFSYNHDDFANNEHYNYDKIEKIKNARAETLADTAYRISRYMRKARLKAFE